MLIVQRSFATDCPKLYMCSTPIGNLQDVSLRLLDTLRTVDIVAAEDTRHTRKLLAKFDIHVPMLVSYHQHNAEARTSDFQKWWAEGKSIAVVSDAGTPGVSDPGEHAVNIAIEAGVPVVPVPGASAVLAALVASGRIMQPFTFIGFLPRENKKCLEQLNFYRTFPGLLICYEAPHRLLKTVERIHSMFPDHLMTLVKELTKQHETFIYGTTTEVMEHLQVESPRGEYVILLDVRTPESEVGKADTQADEEMMVATMDAAISQIRNLMETGISHADAVKQVSKQTGLRKRDLYNRSLHE